MGLFWEKQSNKWFRSAEALRGRMPGDRGSGERGGTWVTAAGEQGGSHEMGQRGLLGMQVLRTGDGLCFQSE